MSFLVSRSKMFHKILKFLTVLGILSVVNSLVSTCYHSREIASKPYIKFNLAAENDCWHYCKFDEKCNLFSVPKKHKTRTCSLYKENELTVEFKPKYSSNTIYGSKNCLNLPEILNNTQEGTNIFQKSLENGLIIYREDPGLCLEADFDDGSSSKKYGYPVYWSSNCRNAKKWELNCTGIQGGIGGCSKAIVKVRNHPEYCLTFLKRESTWTATMQTCHNETDEDINSMTEYRQSLMLSQIYQVGWNVTLIIIGNVTRVCATLPSESLWNFRVNHTLDGFELLSKQDLLNTPCKNVSVPNGKVLLSDAVPMFLPGEEMTVQCNPGYGAKFDNGSYLKVYNVTCWKFPSLVDCSPLTTELTFEDSNALSLSTAILVEAIALGVCLFIF